MIIKLSDLHRIELLAKPETGMGWQAVDVRFRNLESARMKYEFVILPPGGTLIQEGIVEPAYGQPGGGVEVIFVYGSPRKTVTRGRTLPDS
jgi:hypothetical protein